jgi:hypothetical protein
MQPKETTTMTRQSLRKFVILAALLAAIQVAAPLLPAIAAPPGFPALGSNVFPLTFAISGATTTTKTNVATWVAPFDARILYATAVASVKSAVNTHQNSHGKTNILLKNDSNVVTQGSQVASKFIGLAIGHTSAAGVATETNTSAVLGTPMAATAQNVVAGKTVTADLQMWGNSPSVTDVTLVVWMQRRG